MKAPLLVIVFVIVVLVAIAQSCQAKTLVSPDGISARPQSKVMTTTEVRRLPFKDGTLVCPYPLPNQPVIVLCTWLPNEE